jgi:hypothetical protein
LQQRNILRYQGGHRLSFAAKFARTLNLAACHGIKSFRKRPVGFVNLLVVGRELCAATGALVCAT